MTTLSLGDPATDGAFIGTHTVTYVPPLPPEDPAERQRNPASRSNAR